MDAVKLAQDHIVALNDALEEERVLRMAAESSNRLLKLWWKEAHAKYVKAQRDYYQMWGDKCALEARVAGIESRTGQDVSIDDMLKALENKE